MLGKTLDHKKAFYEATKGRGRNQRWGRAKFEKYVTFLPIFCLFTHFLPLLLFLFSLSLPFNSEGGLGGITRKYPAEYVSD